MSRTVLRRLLPFLALAALAAPTGAQAATATPRIINGTNAAASAWPAQAYVQFTDGGSTYMCGGTLVTPRHVVTAGHCATDDAGSVLPASAYMVAIGTNDLRSMPASVRYAVTKVTRHPSYDPDTTADDIAVLRLARAAEQTPLPIVRADETSIWSAGAAATVLGWGTTELNSTSNVLKQASIPMVSDAGCASTWGATFDRASMVCAGGDTKDTCTGDSGGPLMVQRADHTWALAGLTSFGVVPCGQVGEPGVYTRVGAPDLNAWLRAQVREAGITASNTSPAAGQIVTYSAWATSADGAVGAITWDLDGDGVYGDATGPTAQFAFADTQPHTVSAQATEASGQTLRAAVIVNPPAVTSTPASPGAPGAVTATPTPVPAAPAPVAAVIPRIVAGTPSPTVPAAIRGTALRRDGLRVGLSCAQACTATVRLTVDKGVAKRLHLRSRTIGTGTGRLRAAGTTRVTVRLTKAARRALRGKTLRATASSTVRVGSRTLRSSAGVAVKK